MISIQNITKTFINNTAVNNLSLEIGKGEIYGLLGSNGAGKSTTINILLGFLRPESGKAINEELVAGADVPGESKAFRAQVGQEIGAKSATFRLNGKNLETKPVNSGAKKVVFETRLTKGKHELSPFFHVPEGELGCYYAIITTK